MDDAKTILSSLVQIVKNYIKFKQATWQQLPSHLYGAFIAVDANWCAKPPVSEKYRHTLYKLQLKNHSHAATVSSAREKDRNGASKQPAFFSLSNKLQQHF